MSSILISSSPASFQEPLSSFRFDLTLSLNYYTNFVSKPRVVVLLARAQSELKEISDSFVKLFFFEMIEKKFFYSMMSDRIIVTFMYSSSSLAFKLSFSISLFKIICFFS